MEHMNMNEANDMVETVVETTKAVVENPNIGIGGKLLAIGGAVVTGIGGYFIGKSVKDKDQIAEKQRKKANARYKKQGYIICKQVPTEDGGIMMVPIDEEETK